jgi:hypothetical protein
VVEVLGGVLAVLGLLALCAAPIVLSWWPRPAQAVVTPGSAAGQTGLAIHPDRGQRFMPFVGVLITVGVLTLGASYLGRSPYAAAAFLTVGVYFGYLVWARASGRAGDGTVTMTPEGIHQLWVASEVFVPWEDVRGLVTTPKELIVETRPPPHPPHPAPAWRQASGRPARCHRPPSPPSASAALPADDRAVLHQAGRPRRARHR